MAGRPDADLAASGLGRALARAGDGAFVIGAGGRIVSWNMAAERILGYPVGEVLGRACCAVFAGPDTDGNHLCYAGCHPMTLVRLEQPEQTVEMRARSKGGRAVWLNMSIVMTTTARGERLVVHLFRDVTATKELVALINGRPAPRPGAPVPAPRLPTVAAPGPVAAALSPRELEVLRLMTQGLNTASTAERLNLSGATVRNHVQNIFGKLGVHSRLEAVAFAARTHLF